MKKIATAKKRSVQFPDTRKGVNTNALRKMPIQNGSREDKNQKTMGRHTMLLAIVRRDLLLISHTVDVKRVTEQGVDVSSILSPGAPPLVFRVGLGFSSLPDC